MAAGSDKLFSAITGKEALTGTTAKSTETDTITGGTGRFARASGTYTDAVSSVVVLHLHQPDKPRHHRCCVTDTSHPAGAIPG